MYEQNSILIALTLFAGILLFIDAGFRLGRRVQAATVESIKPQINAILAAVLGVLALLLGFTFSLALQRHDSRSQAVVDESNAIGTAWLRTQLLPAGMQNQAGVLLREYLDVRIKAGDISLAETAAREALLRKAEQISAQLWLLARQAAEQDGRPVTSGMFIQALNDMFDAYGRRDAALNRHVPEVVLYLVFATFLIAGSILGYASGIEGTRAPFATTMICSRALRALRSAPSHRTHRHPRAVEAWGQKSRL